MTVCLDYLKKDLKIKIGSDSIQGLSEILALTGGDISRKCDSVMQIYNTLKENKAEIGNGSAFSTLAMLIGIDATPEVIVSEIQEADEFLKSCKLFEEKSENKKQRLMFAELLVASSYGTGSSMINNTFVNTAISVIKAQHIATMISIFSNVLSGVLGAVADKGKSEKNSDESAQSKSNESRS